MLNIVFAFLSVFTLQPSNSVPKNPSQVTLNYIEYNRGASFPTRAQIGIDYPGFYELTFHDVRMIGNSFYPDNSILPNAFIWPLLEGKLRASKNAFTEPYYGLRFTHFFKKNPNLGIGLEFAHLKVFIPDEGESVRITGMDNGKSVDEWKSTKEYIDSFNVSHGVNHLSLFLVYRLMLLQTEKIGAGKIQPYLSMGYGPCFPHPQLRLKGDPEYKAYGHQFNFANYGLSLGLGSRFQISKGFGFYLEYKFTKAYLKEMKFDNGEEGTMHLNFPVHHLAWGFSIIF